MSNNNKFRFDIPVPIIVVAFFVNPVIGIVLTVLRSISSGIKSGTNAGSQKQGSNPYYHTSANTKETKSSAKSTSAKKKASTAYKMMIAGFVVCIILALIAGLVVESAGLASVAMALLPFLIGSAGFFFGSKLVKKRDVRYARIRTLIGNRHSINLTKIATASNESLKRIRKDVQRMIDNGEFGDKAYIDLGTNNFMRTPDATPDDPDQFDYRKVYGNVFSAEKQAGKQQTEGSSEKADKKSSDKDNFDTIIREIRRLNDEIEDAEVSDRIYKIEAHTKNIFDYVTDHPEAMPQIRTFMNYYLPTTLKLLETYSRIERVGVAGENMKKSKENIEKTLDLLVVGFEGQIDQLFKNESIDISSDIAVLETMMKKDGISGKSNFDIASMLDSYTDEISDDLSSDGASAAKASTTDSE